MTIEGYIYCATCLKNGKSYFGQTIQLLEKRWKRHIRDSKKGSDHKFHRAIRKYGEENFLVEEVMFVEASTKEALKRKLDYLERHFIQKFDTRKCGYNETDGGEGILGFKLSTESRKKISDSRIGKLNPNYGKKLSEEHRRNIGLSVRGKYKMTEKHRNKLKEVNSGRLVSEETKRKISESKKGMPAWNKGLKCSEEWRKHNSEAHKGEKNHFFGKKHSEETRKKMSEAKRRNRYEILV